jgi:hypothetical protein
MNIDPSAHLEAFYAALRIGALLVAVGALADPFPAELDQLVGDVLRAVPTGRQG